MQRRYSKLSLTGLVFLFLFGTAFTCSKRVPKVEEPTATATSSEVQGNQDQKSTEGVPQENLTTEENK